jgi:hypothetical protein
MTEPTKCPRCGTEGCPATWTTPYATYPLEARDREQFRRDSANADFACSARAQTELLRKLIGMVAGCMSNGCLDVTLR